MNVSEVVPKILAAQDTATNKRKRWILEIEENNPEAQKVIKTAKNMPKKQENRPRYDIH